MLSRMLSHVLQPGCSMCDWQTDCMSEMHMLLDSSAHTAHTHRPGPTDTLSILLLIAAILNMPPSMSLILSKASHADLYTEFGERDIKTSL